MEGLQILLILVIVAVVGAVVAILISQKQQNETSGGAGVYTGTAPAYPPPPGTGPAGYPAAAEPVPVHAPPAGSVGTQPPENIPRMAYPETEERGAEAVPAVPLPVPGPGAEPPAPVPDPPAEEPPAPVQHTIYTFERVVQVYVCPRCDGENGVNRSVCCICGYEFRKGVRWL